MCIAKAKNIFLEKVRSGFSKACIVTLQKFGSTNKNFDFCCFFLKSFSRRMICQKGVILDFFSVTMSQIYGFLKD